MIFNAGKQRVFRARNKLDEPGLISHITQRAAGKEPLFLEENDYLSMLDILKKKAELYKLNFLALCLMPNHIHILIKPEERSLFTAMKDIFSNYAIRFNRKYQRRGHLFGGPYRQAVCFDAAYLLAASIYIHMNPARSGLIDAAFNYRWSSCALYLRKEYVESFVDPRPVLELLDKDISRAAEQYRLFLKEAKHAGNDNILEKEGAVEKLCIKLAEFFPSIFGRLIKRKYSVAEGKQKPLSPPELDVLISSFSSMVSTRKPETKKAREYIVQQLRARGFNQQEIAARLEISRKTVYNILNS